MAGSPVGLSLRFLANRDTRGRCRGCFRTRPCRSGRYGRQCHPSLRDRVAFRYPHYMSTPQPSALGTQQSALATRHSALAKDCSFNALFMSRTQSKTTRPFTRGNKREKEKITPRVNQRPHATAKYNHFSNAKNL